MASIYKPKGQKNYRVAWHPMPHVRKVVCAGPDRTAGETGRPVRRVSGPDRAVAYRLAVGTGFRTGELASPTPESFDLNADPPTVTVLASYSKRRRTYSRFGATWPTSCSRSWPAGNRAGPCSRTWTHGGRRK
jgi:hypothetical protein